MQSSIKRWAGTHFYLCTLLHTSTSPVSTHPQGSPSPPFSSEILHARIFPKPPPSSRRLECMQVVSLFVFRVRSNLISPLHCMQGNRPCKARQGDRELWVSKDQEGQYGTSMNNGIDALMALIALMRPGPGNRIHHPRRKSGSACGQIEITSMITCILSAPIIPTHVKGLRATMHDEYNNLGPSARLTFSIDVCASAANSMESVMCVKLPMAVEVSIFIQQSCTSLF